MAEGKLTHWQAEMNKWGMGYARHWDIKPDSLFLRGADPRDGLSIFRRKEKIRRDWFGRNGLWDQHVPKVYAGTVVLKFSLWEQAEVRHRGEAPVKKKDKILLKQVKAVTWGPEAITARFVSIAEAEAWKPQKEIFVTSGRKLVMPDE